MFRYEWKKLLHNKFFLILFVLLFIVNAVLSFTEAKEAAEKNYSYDDKTQQMIMELAKEYSADPEAWEKEYARLQEYYEEYMEEARKEHAGEGSYTIDYGDDPDMVKHSRYQMTMRFLQKIDSYPEDIKKVIRAAKITKEDLLAAGVKESDYAYEYQDQIIELYSVNKLIPLKYEYMQGWDKYFAYTNGNVLLVMLLLFLVPGLTIEEYAGGMYPILHATKKGRPHVILCKLGVLLCTVTASVLLYTATTLLFYGTQCGFSSLDNYIQAFTDYKYCPEIVTVGDLLLNSVLAKILVLFALGALILLLSSLIKKYALTFVASLGVVGINLVLHFLPSVDMASLPGTLKLLGCFTYMDVQTGYTRYHALNLFNNALPYLSATAILYGILAAICTAFVVLLFCRTGKASHLLRHKEEGKLKKKLRLPPVAIPLPTRTLVGAELHKNLISNKYILVLAAVLLLKGVLSANTWEHRESFEDSVYKEYMTRLAGEMTEEKSMYVWNERVRIDSAISNQNQVIVDFREGRITEEEYYEQMDEASYALQRTEIFKRVENQNNHISKLKLEGRDAYFVYDTGWRQVLSGDFDWLLYGVALLLFAGLFAEEYRSGTTSILRATKKGRKQVWRAKVWTSLLLITALFAIFTAMDIINAVSTFDLPMVDAPLQSITELAELPDMSIKEYLILCIAIRYLALLSLTVIILQVSLLTKKVLNTLSIVAIATILPYLLRRLGLGLAEYFDYTYLLGGAHFLKTASAHPVYAVFFIILVPSVVMILSRIGNYIWVDAGIRQGGTNHVENQ